MTELRLSSAVLAMAFVAAPAHALEQLDATGSDAERDALLEKITRGVDYEVSVRRFGELLKARDSIIATSAAAKDAERGAHEARRAWQDAYRKTADHEVGWRCTLSPDPAHPLPSKEARFVPDWGKVVRKEQIRYAPKNALDEGEPATLYEVAGVARRYIFRGEKFGPFRETFDAAVGDLVLVCNGGETTERRLPPAWGEKLVHSGFAVRLAKPPLIVDKARYAPIHITGSAFFWAIKNVEWKWAGGHVLSNLEIGRELGGGRFDMPASGGLSWVLEVPNTLKHRELVVPGHDVWLILGEHRFDATLKKLVLVATDVEATYVLESPKR